MRSHVRVLAMCGVALAALLFCGAAIAQTAASPVNAPHNPYTIKGFLVRGEIQVGIPEPFGMIVPDMGPVVFQEIAPCTLVSTIDTDNYPAPWGGPKFVPFESRTYPAAGTLINGAFVNPCSGQIPAAAKALAVRIHAVKPSSDGMFSVSWGDMPPATGLKALDFTAGAENVMEETGVMLNPAGRFALAVTDAATDAVVEVNGFFMADNRKAQPANGLFMWTIEGDQIGLDHMCVTVPADAVAVQCVTNIGFINGTTNASVAPPATGLCTAYVTNGCLHVNAWGHYTVTMLGPTAP